MRVLLVTIAASALMVSPAICQTSQHQQQKQVQKRESPGEAASQNQRGGLKKDRKISHENFRSEYNRMRSTRGYRDQ